MRPVRSQTPLGRSHTDVIQFTDPVTRHCMCTAAGVARMALGSAGEGLSGGWRTFRLRNGREIPWTTLTAGRSRSNRGHNRGDDDYREASNLHFLWPLDRPAVARPVDSPSSPAAVTWPASSRSTESSSRARAAIIPGSPTAS